METNQQVRILGVPISIEELGLTDAELTELAKVEPSCTRNSKKTNGGGTISDLDANALNCILKNLSTEDLKTFRSTNTSLFNAVMPLFKKVGKENLNPIFENLLLILLNDTVELHGVSLDVYKLNGDFHRLFALTLTDGNICININSKVVFNEPFKVSTLREYINQSLNIFSSLSDEVKQNIISAIQGKLTEYTYTFNVYPKVFNTQTQNPKKSLLQKLLLKLDLIKVSTNPIESKAKQLLQKLQAVQNPYSFTYTLKNGGARSYESMTVVELKKRCAKRGLKNYSMLCKADIIRLLRK
jgi:hypothetical protein